jgi:uncharacterized protein (DUF2062 family)
MPIRRRFRFFPPRAAWVGLLRDPERPGRTAAGVALGAAVGATPVLGVHTWMAGGLAALLRLPPAAAVLASNLSNPLTFLPLTWLEIQVGSWVLGRPLPRFDRDLRWETLLPYLEAAWVGTLPVALVLAVAAGGIAWVISRRVHRSRPLPPTPEDPV